MKRLWLLLPVLFLTCGGSYTPANFFEVARKLAGTRFVYDVKSSMDNSYPSYIYVDTLGDVYSVEFVYQNWLITPQQKRFLFNINAITLPVPITKAPGDSCQQQQKNPS